MLQGTAVVGSKLKRESECPASSSQTTVIYSQDLREMIPSGISVRLENRGHLPKGSRGNPAEGCPRATIPDPAPFACRPPWEAALLCLYLIDHQSIGLLNSLHQGCRKLSTWAVLEGLSKKRNSTWTKKSKSIKVPQH